jgi:DNA-binding NarL/FixJ family response regulator
MRTTIDVLVLGDDTGRPSALYAAIEEEPRLRLCGNAAVSAATAMVASAQPALVVVRAAARRVPDALAAVRRADASVRVLVVGTPDAPDLVAATLAAGGCGVLPEGLPAPVVREALLRAHAGELVLEDEDVRKLVQHLADSRPRRQGTGSLTSRELEVLRAIADGASTAEIAAGLAIKEATVRAHVKSILAKLDVHSKLEAVRIAWREGLVAVPA